MRTASERITAMHERAQRMRRDREKAALARFGTANGALFLGLCALIFGTGQGHGGVSPGAFTGAAMLFENAGGYVLVALIAFTAGTAITAGILRYRKTHAPDGGNGKDEKNEGGPDR
jgi:hypothetical protein